MTFFKPDSLILYVKNIQISTAFYSQILQQEPQENFQDFCVFILDTHFFLGLQTKTAILPTATEPFGGLEICMGDVTHAEVDNLYQQWQKLDIPMLLPPTQLEFGYTFVAIDPDGHRLRVCATDTSQMI